jgi:hypothetical protein
VSGIVVYQNYITLEIYSRLLNKALQQFIAWLLSPAYLISKPHSSLIALAFPRLEIAKLFGDE